MNEEHLETSHLLCFVSNRTKKPDSTSAKFSPRIPAIMHYFTVTIKKSSLATEEKLPAGLRDNHKVAISE